MVLARALDYGLNTIDDPQDRALMEFWMNAGIVNELDDVVGRCNVNYTRELQNRIESDMMSSHMDNLMELYKFVEYDLLSSCGIQLSDLAREVILSLSAQEIGALEEPIHEFNILFSRGTQNNNITFKSLAETMMWAMGADLCLNRTSFVDTWYRGPCHTILDKVSQTNMQPLMNFVDMVTDVRVHPLELSSDVRLHTVGAVSAIRYCQYFSSELNLNDAWDALQTSETYQSIRHQIESIINRADRH